MDNVIDSFIQKMATSLSFARFGSPHPKSVDPDQSAVQKKQKLGELIVDWPRLGNDSPSCSMEKNHEEKKKTKKKVRFSESSEMRVYWIEQTHLDNNESKYNSTICVFDQGPKSKSNEAQKAVEDSNELFSLYSRTQRSNTHGNIPRARRSISSARAA
mmetsp:Transcript_26340/g.55507  ORF Transcript_26340/g.55507 Transcript_26340/m.55507 type:complete len:158 (-) Transcript_26340:207-680(-)